MQYGTTWTSTQLKQSGLVWNVFWKEIGFCIALKLSLFLYLNGQITLHFSFSQTAAAK